MVYCFDGIVFVLCVKSIFTDISGSVEYKHKYDALLSSFNMFGLGSVRMSMI